MLFAFSIVVKGWATFLKPIALSLGAVFTAFNLDLEELISDIKPIELRSLFSKDKDKDVIDSSFNVHFW